MQDITEQLNLAKILIHNMLASHQGTPEAAVEYATRQLDLPPDVKHDLIHYARKIKQ